MEWLFAVVFPLLLLQLVTKIKIGKQSDIPDDADESGFTDASLGDNVEDDNEEASTRYSKR